MPDAHKINIMTGSIFDHRIPSKKRVAISAYVPAGYKGERYKALAPPFWIVRTYQETKQEIPYIERYSGYVLDLLDPVKVANDLNGKVLLCYEKAGQFCHRRLVAEWLEKHLGISVPEFE